MIGIYKDTRPTLAADEQRYARLSARGAVVTQGDYASTGTVSSVASGIASVTILAANTSRVGAVIVNTDANALHLLLSNGTASTTNYTAKVAAGGEYTVPSNYTGIIVGIWAADGTGSAVVTELTP